MSRGGPDDEKDPFSDNGSAAPAAIELRAGKRYRFRFIMITPAPNLWVTLDRGGQRQVWSSIAKDGAMLPRRKLPAYPPMSTSIRVRLTISNSGLL